MIIRDATPADGQEACAVLRASIAQLCSADHRNDADILSRWLANKTSENVATWADNDGRSLLVAIRDRAIVAVGGVRDSGEITLNYVAPQARFSGVSSALLAALEARAAERGARRCSAPRPRIDSISRVAMSTTDPLSASSARRRPIRCSRCFLSRRVRS
ncbi:GNAT family N-acetyltransferase [Bradyrhizobium sp. SZCCHNPS2010]|uniref:GNAT family N-acetyltransferase n=1 Tax=Bradyrhizobium sp. SZCCHNPS2010 TaxID=3057333 RepID=UPI0029170B0D|nr:GNAT family N-acetyltransferase [Bradyrhizobium sp. SZCCHNPS2010]